MTRAAWFLAVMTVLGGIDLSAQPTLRIVVIEGEDAVNIVQQKTATAPVVEVRDRNNQPVAGAVVRFAITRGRASFNGARTLSVATNAAGRAAVSGLTPTGTGALQITASATFQGQTVAATIAQTNVMTVAEASAAASAGGSGGAGGAGAAGTGTGGTGGGLSATTLGIVGGAAAGGVIAARKVFSTDFPEYVGPMQGQVVQTTTAKGGQQVSCTTTSIVDNMLTMHVEATAPAMDGFATASGTQTFTATTCNGPLPAAESSGFQGTLSGTPSTITFQQVQSGTFPNPGTWSNTITFVGALSGNVITGTVTIVYTADFPNNVSFGRQDFPVTLTQK